MFGRVLIFLTKNGVAFKVLREGFAALLELLSRGTTTERVRQARPVGTRHKKYKLVSKDKWSIFEPLTKLLIVNY